MLAAFYGTEKNVVKNYFKQVQAWLEALLLLDNLGENRFCQCCVCIFSDSLPEPKCYATSSLDRHSSVTKEKLFSLCSSALQAAQSKVVE